MTKIIAAMLAAIIFPLAPVRSPAAVEDTAPPPGQISAVTYMGQDACQPDMAQTVEGTVLLPFVQVSIAAGFDDIQCGDDGWISVSDGSRSVSAAAGEKYLTVDGHYLWLGAPAEQDMEELLVPMEPLCAALGLTAQWQQDTGIIALETAREPHAWQEHDPWLLLWLARVVWAEARGECLEGRIAVAQVVLNRMASPHYPDTVTGVLFQPGQFSTAQSGAIWNSADEGCFLAARLALDGADIVGDECLFFNSCPGYTPGLTYLTTIGGHKFYAL